MSPSMLNMSTIQELRDQLPDSIVLLPGSEEYRASIKRWSDGAEKPAALVILPSTERDISTAITFAKKHGMDLAVAGGGHSTSGAASTAGGLLLDLSRLRGVTVDPEGRTITAQGGALWEDVDTALGQHGLATVGGVVNHTGIGGLTLGGGYGWLTGLYGLTIDNLLSARIVLADGRVLATSPTLHPDLFWALRGAGHNFGVITEFTFQAHEQKNEVFAGLLGFTPDKLEQVVGFANALVADEGLGGDGRSAIYCFLAVPPGAPRGTGPTILTAVVSITSEEEARRRFAPLLKLDPVMDTLAMVPYCQVNAMLNGIAVHGDRKNTKGFSFAMPLRPGLARSVLTELGATLQEEPAWVKSYIVFEFGNLGKVAAVPRGDMAFANRSRCQNGVVQIWWMDEKDDARAGEKGRHLKALITTEAEKREGKEEGGAVVYSNFVETGDRSIEELFGENLDRLRLLKAKYDPTNLFNKTHPLVSRKDAGQLV
ncbi:FAD binding domain protein [Aspergillus uvarum CBS 121591]|uniref:FAD binding domain protein n=1 Tax=Aspergillus uvarum CBS 121591 TaxID=1448315 RepID=A0A319D6W1_9EURO|nr:FAD binding domain protein [Aspergillus uvarum CBS 121591]PYH75712.1 FAD binding domain protein [Aspergillus uvarum CBS 121591]